MAEKEIKTIVKVNFSEAADRSKPSSGEGLHLIVGKIVKWLSDLKSVAFSGSFNDLTDTPEFVSPTDIVDTKKYYIKENVVVETYTATTDTKTYTLSDKFNPDRDNVEVYYKNIRLIEGINFTRNGNTITITFTIPQGESVDNIIKTISLVKV